MSLQVYNPVNLTLVLNGRDVSFAEAVEMCDKGNGIFEKWGARMQDGTMITLFVGLRRYDGLPGVKTRSLQFRQNYSPILTIEFPK